MQIQLTKSISNNSGVTISNPELRQQVILLYERHFTNIHNRERHEKQILIDYYIPLTLKYFKYSGSIQKNLFGNTSNSVNTAINVQELSRNNEYLNTVVHLTSRRETNEYFLSETMLELEKVIKEIDSEINRLN